MFTVSSTDYKAFVEASAEQFLKENPVIKQELETKIKNDKQFAKNWYAQLSFVFKKTPHYEKAHMRYPIYRVPKN